MAENNFVYSESDKHMAKTFPLGSEMELWRNPVQPMVYLDLAIDEPASVVVVAVAAIAEVMDLRLFEQTQDHWSFVVVVQGVEQSFQMAAERMKGYYYSTGLGGW